MCDIHEIVFHGVFAEDFLIAQELDEARDEVVFYEQLAFCG